MRADTIITAVAIDLGYDDTDNSVRAALLPHLNRACREIANRSQSLREIVGIAAVASQYRYALPANFLSARLAQWQNDPPLIRARLQDILTERQSILTGTPEHYDQWTKASIEYTSGAAEGGSGTTLDDTTKDFTAAPDLVYVGAVVRNTTDNSTGTVTAVAATQLTFSAGLSGGSDNTFVALDAYIVESPSRPLFEVIIHPAPASSDAAGVYSITVYYNKAHRDISANDITNLTDDLELDPEFESALIFRTLYWAVGQGSKERRALNVDYNTAYYRALPAVNSRLVEPGTTFRGGLATRNLDITGKDRTLPWWFGV